MKELLIPFAYNKRTGAQHAARELFDHPATERFKRRREYHEGELWVCCECLQDLTISTSVKDKLFFKHKPNSGYCILSDAKISSFEQNSIYDIFRLKESDRHKELKNKIGALLKITEGVDVDSVMIDTQFLLRNSEKRRPDVYCRYLGKEIVFEIQLSQLSLGYLVSRYNFYKSNGIYLIWILDNFDIYGQEIFERDIKYLTAYENFFKLDESATTLLKLACDYKVPYIYEETIRTKWMRKSVALADLNFNENIFQPYYYNLPFEKQKKENELQNMFVLARERAVAGRMAAAKETVRDIIAEITKRKENNFPNYGELKEKISILDSITQEKLNEQLGLTRRQRDEIPILNYWIRNSKESYDYFLEFILSTHEIDIDISTREGAISLFEEVLLNQKIYHSFLIKLLLKRGYKITENDEKVYLQRYPDDASMFLLYRMCSWLTDVRLVDSVFKFYQLLYTIQSAVSKKIVGYKFTSWVAFANNTVEHHSQYWQFIEPAFKKTGIWEIILAADKNDSFKRKLANLYQNMPEQKDDFSILFRELYPEFEYL
jgi:hypothetical protein